MDKEIIRQELDAAPPQALYRNPIQQQKEELSEDITDSECSILLSLSPEVSIQSHNISCFVARVTTDPSCLHCLYLATSSHLGTAGLQSQHHTPPGLYAL